MIKSNVERFCEPGDLPLHDARRINWKEEEPAIEASDLTANSPLSLLFGYIDGHSKGFRLFNINTRKATVWRIVDVQFDQDGDILWWRLVPMPEEYRRFPKLRGKSLMVFND